MGCSEWDGRDDSGDVCQNQIVHSTYSVYSRTNVTIAANHLGESLHICGLLTVTPILHDM